jgi:lipoprotein NlpI
LSATLENQKANDFFEKAVAENKAVIDKEPQDNAAAYKRRGLDLYWLGDFKNAVAAYDVAIQRDKNYLAAVFDRGYARFALAQFDDAADDFSRALALPRDRAYSMIWLYLSRQHSRVSLGDAYYRKKGRNEPIPSLELLSNASKLIEANREENLKELKRRAKLAKLSEQDKLDILDRRDWPIPVIELFLGSRSREDVLAHANDSDSQCEANFYIGEWQVLRGELEHAVKSLQKSIEVCPSDFVELPGAKAVLRRLGR